MSDQGPPTVNTQLTGEEDVWGSGEKQLRLHKLTERAYEIYEQKVCQHISHLRDIKQDIELDLTAIQRLIKNQDSECCKATKLLLLPKITAYNELSNNFISYLRTIQSEQSNLELTSHNVVHRVLTSKIDYVLSEIDKFITPEVPQVTKQSNPTPTDQTELNEPVIQKSAGSHSVHSHSSRHSSHSSSVSVILMKQSAKVVAAKTRLKFAEKQAQLQQQKAKLTSDMELLQKQADVEEAEAELDAMDAQIRQSDILSLSIEKIGTVNKNEYTQVYINEQNSRIKQGMMNFEVGNPQELKTMTPKPPQLRPTPYLDVLSTSENVEHSLKPRYPLNPSVQPFISNQHCNEAVNNMSFPNDITKFLLKKDLLLSRFSTFNDQPETYSVWKSSFSNITQELCVTPSEELDLLVKWLGAESSKHALSLRASNSNNPEKGLERLWNRLDERYGGPEMIESTLKMKLANFPKLTPKDHKKLYELSDILAEIESIKENPNYSQLLSYYDTSSGVNPVVTKLPYNLQGKWIDRAISYKQKYKVAYPPFTIFVQFVRDMSTYMNDPSFILEHNKPRDDYKTTSHTHTDRYHKTFSKSAISAKKTDITPEASKPEKKPSCPLHNTEHSLNNCRAFKLKPYEERRQFLKENNVCYRCCESQDHSFMTCTVTVKCSDCGSDRHPTALHKSKAERFASRTLEIPDGGEQTFLKGNISSKCTAVCGNDFSGKSCAKTLLVDILSSNSNQGTQPIRAYAIIDDQSNRTLGKSKLFDMLNVSSEPVPYTLSSCSGDIKTSGRKASGYAVRSVDGTVTLNLPTITECHEMPDDRSEISTPNIAKQFDHLKHLAEYIPPLNQDAEILLIIGRDLIEAHHVKEQITGPMNSPFAQRLCLGWVIIGEVCLGNVHKPSIVNVNKINVVSNLRGTIFEPCSNNFQIKEDFMSHDSIGDTVFLRTKDDDKLGNSQEDKEFLKLMESEFHKDDAGNWTAPLPFRSPKVILPNNRTLALKRAKMLDASLKLNPVKKDHFVTFMERIFKNGAAEVAPALSQRDCWYLPIFGVYHPKKPDQIRGVFDSSATQDGVSLNSVLLTGPDLTNNLLGVLLRFRKDEYAITADIEQMFYSFYVREDHRDYLRFFWYRDNNPDNELIEFRMRVHVFGNSPSPAVATYGLRKAVEKSQYGSDVSEFVNRNFYVDDALTSLPTSSQAIELIQRTQQALKDNGNIRLHKIASNSELVMNAFPTEDLSKDLKSLDIGEDILPLQRSLGLAWDLNLDSFTFKIHLEDKPYTRRGVLSTVNSLFDPMGFIAPVIIHGKYLLREMLAHGSDWDQPLLPDHEHQWIEWRNSLELLEDLFIPRMYLSCSASTAPEIELHIYSDASEKAISAVAYLRTVSKDGSTHVGFVMGKSKLAPTNGHTIPRLELCAAVMAVEIYEIIMDNLDVTPCIVKFHTDSKVILGYLSNRTRRFYTYVSNRIDRILRSTTPEDWNYVSTEKNPADQGTRCLSTANVRDSMWLLGPPQLHFSDVQITRDDNFPLIDPEFDKEVRPHIEVKKTNISKDFCDRFQKFSCWKRLVNAIAFLKRVAAYKKSQPCKEKEHIPPRSVNSFKESELHIIKLVQRSFYSEEIECINNNKNISKTSQLYQLDPILDANGVLRIGGRLNKAKLSIDVKNPVIIPGKSHIAYLLVTYFHERIQHQGRHFTEGAIRSGGYWIIGAKRLISSILHKCFKCRKLRGSLEYQKMADLPVDRLTPGPPFSSVGVDTFGPWQVVTRRTRGGQANSKRWAILFSCLTTRAVHIEVIEDISSSAFINALRRFISLRGDVTEFRSDRGTNFIGATDDLQINAINVEDRVLKNFLYDHGTVWIFNAPHSSHMGGAWERLIGVTRRILDSMLMDINYLTHDVLVTLMAEVCAIINSRPISAISSDPESPEIISPALLLTQKAGIKPVPSDSYNIKDIYKSQWKQVQHLSDIFWKHWKDEYIHNLQYRRKWINDRPNAKIGDVVLLKDKELHRNDWPIGLVINAIKSDDNKVRKVVIRVVKDGKISTYTRPITDIVILID